MLSCGPDIQFKGVRLGDNVDASVRKLTDDGFVFDSDSKEHHIVTVDGDFDYNTTCRLMMNYTQDRKICMMMVTLMPNGNINSFYKLGSLFVKKYGDKFAMYDNCDYKNPLTKNERTLIEGMSPMKDRCISYQFTGKDIVIVESKYGFLGFIYFDRKAFEKEMKRRGKSSI